MINMFKVRRYIALILLPIFVVILFYIGALYYGLIYGLVFMGVGIILNLFLGSIILMNPFTKMLEGKGLLALNLDSTGIIRPFIVGLHSPYIKGTLNKKEINDVFDRDTVFQIAAPIKNKKKAEIKEGGGIKIELDEKNYNEGRFALFHYPVLIWNEQMNSILTKEFLSEAEKDAFAMHGILYLNRKVEELTTVMRDFGRYVVELLKPKSDWYKSKWIWIIAIVLMVLLVVLFLPAVLKNFGVNLSMPSLPSPGGGAVVTPR